MQEVLLASKMDVVIIRRRWLVVLDHELTSFLKILAILEKPKKINFFINDERMMSWVKNFNEDKFAYLVGIF